MYLTQTQSRNFKLKFILQQRCFVRLC